MPTPGPFHFPFPDPMTRFPTLRVLTALLALAPLAACDSARGGDDGPNLEGYTGDPDLLGMWTETR